MAGCMMTEPLAVALRSVSALSETSTMRALPSLSKWVKPAIVYSAATAGACRPSKARVASVTSACRIRDSPTRKTEAPTRCMRSRSAVA